MLIIRPFCAYYMSRCKIYIFISGNPHGNSTKMVFFFLFYHGELGCRELLESLKLGIIRNMNTHCPRLQSVSLILLVIYLFMDFLHTWKELGFIQGTGNTHTWICNLKNNTHQTVEMIQLVKCLSQGLKLAPLHPHKSWVWWHACNPSKGERNCRVPGSCCLI